MRNVARISELDHPEGISTGLVPTMGAFHEGHLRLMRQARSENARLVVSLFVNPTQFGPDEDLSRYPRDLERDSELARSVGVDVLFCPSVEEVYPRTPAALVRVPVVTERFEGAYRPGHFDGVATVVAKMMNIVRPTTSYFGLKDLQQCAVIRRMVEDLNIPTALKFVPTVRESDGLAMSSRNAYLSEEDRAAAPKLQVELARLAKLFRASAVSHCAIDLELARSRQALEGAGFRVDYLDLIDYSLMSPIRSLVGPMAVVVAARIGKTRLIDNLIL